MKIINSLCKCKKRILYLAFLTLLVVLVLLLFVNNKRILIKSYSNDKLSFYYRDTLNIDSILPQYSSYDFVVNNKNIITDGRLLFFKKPEEITINDLHLNVNLFLKNDTINKQINVRCWRNKFNILKETTKRQFVRGSLLYRLANAVKRKLFNIGVDGIIINGDSSYIFEEGVLHIKTPNTYYRAGMMILESSQYNQIIQGDRYLFLRNNNKLYVSVDNFKTSKLVYNDRRGIRESMYWDNSSESLIYSMYTPGHVRVRHYLLKYNPETEITDTLQTFYTKTEFDSLGLTPYCRHIHLINKDPYTNDLYIAVGDYDEEPAIYRSSDGGKTLQLVGGGSQLWRTLSIFYTKDYIFWTNDTESPQYICRISRQQIHDSSITSESVMKFPLFNSALWCNIKVSEDKYIVGSNSEGMFYDDWHRMYMIEFSNEGVPTVYCINEEKSLSDNNGIIYHQNFPIAVDDENHLWTYDSHLDLRKYAIDY